MKCLNLNDKYIIKRIGSENPTSGSVFKSNGCMYLFSTGTIYPHEKLITPFIAYTYKYHNGNFTESASKIYKDGYGTRVVKKEVEIEKRELPKINESDLVFPIDIFPKPIQSYIIECNETLDSSVDYMGCSMLWLISVIVGNSIQIEVKKGWNETATIWLAVVGKAGLGKTPSIHNIIKPLLSANNKEIKNYIKQAEKYEYYEKAKEILEYYQMGLSISSKFINDTEEIGNFAIIENPTDGFGNYIVELSNRAYRFGFYLTNRETGKTYDKKNCEVRL